MLSSIYPLSHFSSLNWRTSNSIGEHCILRYTLERQAHVRMNSVVVIFQICQLWATKVLKIPNQLLSLQRKVQPTSCTGMFSSVCLFLEMAMLRANTQYTENGKSALHATCHCPLSTICFRDSRMARRMYFSSTEQGATVCS